MLGAGCGARSELSAIEASRDGAGLPEVCNGVDDDGNGLVDEDIAPISCGQGRCRQSVACHNGRFDTCAPGRATAETCNGMDDDCDGDTDEGLGLALVFGPVVVRDDEGRTSTDPSCSSCRTAFGPQLLHIDNHLQLIWALGNLGTDRKPNVYGRRYSLLGEPLDSVLLLGDTMLQASWFRAAPSSDHRTLITGCAPEGSQHRAASLFLEPDGMTVSSLVYREPEASCGAMRPSGVWTGTHHLFAWTENSSSRPGQQVLLDVANERGESLGSTVVRDDGGFLASPQLSVAHDRVLLVYSTKLGRTLETRLVGSDGSLASEGNLLEPLGEERWTSAVVAATSQGWLVLATSESSGLISALLDASGRLLVASDRDDGNRLSAHALIGWQTKRLALLGASASEGSSTPFVAVLDESGEMLEQYPLSTDVLGAFAWPHAVSAEGRIWITYAEPRNDGAPNRVMLAAIGCR